MQGAFLDDDGGHGTPALVDPRLEDLAYGAALRIGLELEHLGLQQDGVEQVVDAFLLQGADAAVERLSAPLLRHEADVGKLLHDALGVGVGQVALVDGDDDGHIGRPCMVDGLACLGHDAVVRGDDQDDDVGDLGATGPHHGEGGVARSVEEDDIAASRDVDLVGADVLGDAAELSAGDVG